MNTFIIRIISEENSTWQGQIEWIDEKQTQNFRSMLELIRLIDTAVSQEPEYVVEKRSKEEW